MSRRKQLLAFTALVVALAINQAAAWAKVRPLPAVVPTVADTVAYEEITLSDAVHRALAQNVAALVARDEVRRSEALLVQARSAALPAILLEGTLARYSADRALPGAENVRAASATIRVPLIAPRAWATWSEAAANVATTAAGDEDARRTVAVSVARAFIAVTSLKRRVQAATRAVGNNRAHYNLTHARFAAGAGSRVDEVRAAQQLATDEATLSTVYVALSRAREALSILVGADEPLDTSDQIGLRGGDADVAAAQRQRSDVRAARQRVAAAERVKTGSSTDFAPALVGEAQLLYQDPPIYQVAPTPTIQTSGWQAFLSLSFPIFEGGLRVGQLRERDALLSEARAQYQALLRQTRSDVRTAVQVVRRADEAMRASSTAAELARQGLDLATAAYQAGAASNIEIIDAVRQARDADAGLVVAEDGVKQARLDLLVAAGQFP